MARQGLSNEEKILILKNISKSGEEVAQLLVSGGRSIQSNAASVHRKKICDDLFAYVESHAEEIGKNAKILPSDSDRPHCCNEMVIWSKDNHIPTTMKFCPFCGASIITKPFTPQYMVSEVNKLLKNHETDKINMIVRELLVDLGYKDLLHLLIHNNILKIG